MRRTLGLAVTALLVGATAAACAQTSSADVSSKHLSIVGQDTRATTLEQVDVGKPGFGPGDELIEENPATDASGKDVAKLYTIVTMTSGRSMADAVGIIDCHVVFAAGSVLFNGSIALKNLPAGVTVPVIGGTGAYDGAGGTVRMQAPTAKQTNLTFDLLIPRRTK